MIGYHLNIYFRLELKDHLISLHINEQKRKERSEFNSQPSRCCRKVKSKRKTLFALTGIGWQDLGNQSFSNGNFQKAIELYTQAIELEKSAIYFANRSFAYFELGQFKDSLEDAEIAINLNKDYAKVADIGVSHQITRILGIPKKSLSTQRARQNFGMSPYIFDGFINGVYRKHLMQLV